MLRFPLLLAATFLAACQAAPHADTARATGVYNPSAAPAAQPVFADDNHLSTLTQLTDADIAAPDLPAPAPSAPLPAWLTSADDLIIPFYPTFYFESSYGWWDHNHWHPHHHRDHSPSAPDRPTPPVVTPMPPSRPGIPVTFSPDFHPSPLKANAPFFANPADFRRRQ